MTSERNEFVWLAEPGNCADLMPAGHGGIFDAFEHVWRAMCHMQGGEHAEELQVRKIVGDALADRRSPRDAK